MTALNKNQFGEKMAATLKTPATPVKAYDDKVLRMPRGTDGVWRGPIGTSHRMNANRSRDV